MYIYMVKMVCIDLFEFAAVIVAGLFCYSKMTPFINAALSLGYINGQTVSYIIFAALLVTLPIMFLCKFKHINKASLLRYVFYAYAANIICGTIFDIFQYNWFIDYTFIEGDAIFVNLMWNMPNAGGIVLSVIVSSLYILLGKQIKRSRTYSHILYVLIFILSHIPAYVYSFVSTGGLPRNTFLQKSVYVMAIQLLLVIALSIAATSRSVWRKHTWQ